MKSLKQQKRLLDFYEERLYQLEVTDEISLTILNDVLIHKPIIYLKAEVISYLPMIEVVHVKGLFNLLKNTDQIQKLSFKNTSKFNYNLIHEEVTNWSVSDRIEVIELDHNKFNIKAS